MGNVNITTANVPAGYCAGNLPELWTFLVSLLEADLAGSLNTFNDGTTTPSPDDQDKPWFRAAADGLPDAWSRFVGGAWVSKHPMAPGLINLYLGTEASIDTLDGGEVGAVTATTGPMWEKVSAFDARFPVGVGTFPSTTAVLVSGTGGEEKHTLIRTELPDIKLSTDSIIRNNVQDGGTANCYGPDTTVGAFVEDDPLMTEELSGDTDSTNNAHNNLPPYIGVFFIRRTNRTHYRL